MTTRRVESVLILRQTTENPNDAEWDECLALLEEALALGRRVKVFVRTDGGGPSPVQRQRLQERTKRGDVWVAVVSESVKVRFIVSSVALLQTRIASFRVDDFNGAFEHLGLTPAERALVGKNLAEMDRVIGRA